MSFPCITIDAIEEKLDNTAVEYKAQLLFEMIYSVQSKAEVTTIVDYLRNMKNNQPILFERLNEAMMFPLIVALYREHTGATPPLILPDMVSEELKKLKEE